MLRKIASFCLFMIVISLNANSYKVRTFRDTTGKLIDEISVPGIPLEQRKPGPVATPSRSAVMLSGVPAFDWCYGCSATSAAMMMGYYDRGQYPNMYSGPANGGVCPLTNAVWGSGESPLSATHQGYDNLTSAGHVNRFWTGVNNSGDDPYGSGNPTGTYANCTTDYMGTNQDYWGCVDGETIFYNYTDGSPLYDYSGNESANPRHRDGIHGIKLFVESRGYTVTTNYNQYIQGYDGNTLGYTLADYQQSINNGYPVLIQVEGHTMLGVGYESTNNTIYIHDTWDHQVHSMTWGGYYSNMLHYSVGIVQLTGAATYSTITWNPGSFSKTMDMNASSSSTLTIGNSGSATLTYTCALPSSITTVLDETFSSTSRPTGWTEALVSGTTVAWAFAGGGINGYPSAAYDGAYNARLYKSSTTASTVKLITPVLNLSEATSATLSFWHAQASWSGDQDELRIYYKTSFAGAWNLIDTFISDVSAWTQRTISLPNPSATYYVAFEGTAKYGYGVCIDKVVVTKQDDSANSWLRLNNATSVTGTINSGAASNSISIGYNSTGLSAGTYNSTIYVNSNSSTNASLSLPVTLIVRPALGIPQTPSITVNPANGRTTLSWIAATGSPSSYRIYFCAKPDFSSGVVLLGTVPSSQTSYIDTNAASRTKGFYQIKAYRN